MFKTIIDRRSVFSEPHPENKKKYENINKDNHNTNNKNMDYNLF